MVWADRYGLIQVFLNLSKNSRWAMTSTGRKQLRILHDGMDGTVVIRFEDTGTGIVSPENLFRPFLSSAESTGLGLYVSRAIMRSFGGELGYEPSSEGCCFAVVLPLRDAVGEASNA